MHNKRSDEDEFLEPDEEGFLKKLGLYDDLPAMAAFTTWWNNRRQLVMYELGFVLSLLFWWKHSGIPDNTLWIWADLISTLVWAAMVSLLVHYGEVILECQAPRSWAGKLAVVCLGFIIGTSLTQTWETQHPTVGLLVLFVGLWGLAGVAHLLTLISRHWSH